MLFPVKYISASINRPAGEVYRFIANPENLPQWAAGLSDAKLEKEGDDWVANSPMGRVKVSFVKENPFGVVDHDVTLPSGEVNTNPLRVIINGDGSDVVFTLFRRSGMTEEDFENDAGMIEKDLRTLKALMEKK
jgi:carbon monoxide dehydrogenase subunit G